MFLNVKNKINIKRFVSTIAFLTLLISLNSVNQWSTLPIGNEFFWWIVQFSFIYILIQLKKKYSISSNFLFLELFLIWNIICILRGILVAENYWEYKFLIKNSFVLLMPLIVYLANSILTIQLIIRIWIKYALYIFILLLPFLTGEAVGRFLMPFSFLLLFLPVINLKWKVIILITTIFVFFYDFSARSNIIKFAIPFLIGLLYYFQIIFKSKFINVLRLIFLLAPFLLLCFAVLNIFNIFKIDQYIKGTYKTTSDNTSGKLDEVNLTEDSRTFLYIEVINSAIKNNYVICGRTPARGNDSEVFGEFYREMFKTKRLERFSNEVSILNIFTWLGIIGVILYFLIFVKATFLAINRSNNIFVKLVGLNISFRWAYGFVEDFSQFDLSNIFLWIMVGICFSPFFRKMDDTQMKVWVRGIFNSDKNYRVILHKHLNQLIN